MRGCMILEIYKSLERPTQLIRIMELLYTSSTDSLEYHPTNSTWDFTIELPKTLFGSWKCALADITYGGYSGSVYVFTDICKQSYIKDTTLPVLRRVSQSGEVNNLNYITVTRRNIQRVRIYIRDTNLNTLPSSSDPVHCTLVLKPI